MSNVASSAAEGVAAPVVSQGTVKWFDPKRGFGFLTCPAEGGGTMDLFVHQRSINSEGFRTLYENEMVEFTVVPGKAEGQWRAENVVVVTPSKERTKRDAKTSKWAKKTKAPKGSEEE